MKNMRHLVVWVMAAVAGLAACAEEDGPTDIVYVVEGSRHLFIGDSVALAARALCCSDHRDDPYRVKAESDRRPEGFKWWSSDSAIGTVDDRGLLRAVAAGSVRITAAYDGRQGWHEFRITRPIVDIRLEPASKTISVGDTVTFRVTLLGTDATPVDSAFFHVQTRNLGVARFVANSAMSPGDAKFIGTAPGGVAIPVNNDHRIPQRRVLRNFDLTVVAKP